jgi:hypothetical protein
VLIFYLTKSIFFHGDVIRDIGEKGKETRTIRFLSSVIELLVSLDFLSTGVYWIRSRVSMKIGRGKAASLITKHLTNKALNFTNRQLKCPGGLNV